MHIFYKLDISKCIKIAQYYRIMKLEEVFPLINEIYNKTLREQVKKCYAIAMERGGWQTLDNIPFTLLVPNAYPYVRHVNNVTTMAYTIGKNRDDLDLDILIAGALLHDVGKLLEYEEKNGVVLLSKNGKYLRHPISGACIASEVGLDIRVINIIAAHSKEGDLVERCNEAIVIHHCDFIDFEILKGKK